MSDQLGLIRWALREALENERQADAERLVPVRVVDVIEVLQQPDVITFVGMPGITAPGSDGDSNRIILDTTNANIVNYPNVHASPSPIPTVLREQLEQRVGEAWDRCKQPGATVDDVRAYCAAHDELIREVARESL